MQKVMKGKAQNLLSIPFPFGDDDEILNNPAVQAAIAAAAQAEVEKQTEGLKKKQAELLDKLTKQKDTLKEFEGIDPKVAKNLITQMNSNEEMKLIAEGKVDEVVTRRTENLIKDFDTKYTVLNTKLEETLNLLAKKDERIKEFTIDSAIREGYIGLDYTPEALDDVIRLGRSVFIMDESGKAVPRDDAGNVIYGKDAKTAISPTEWLETLAVKKPYLKRASSGSGNKGNNGKGTEGFDKNKASGAELIAEGLKNGLLKGK